MSQEAEFYRQIQRHIPGHLQRIENSAICGMPDLNTCWKDAEVWIELKVDKDGKVLLRKEQYAWGMRRALAGGHVWVMALVGKDLIQFWKFPFKVIPYGISAKYVDIMETAHDNLPIHEKHLIASIIFKF